MDPSLPSPAPESLSLHIETHEEDAQTVMISPPEPSGAPPQSPPVIACKTQLYFSMPLYLV